MSYADSLYGKLIRLSIPYGGSKNERHAIDVLCESRLRSNQFAIIVAAAVIITGFVADVLYYPDLATEFGIVRLTALGVLAFSWFTQRPWNRWRWAMIPLNVFLIASSISVIVSVMIFLSDGAASPYFGGMVLVLIGMAFVMRVAPIEIALYALYVIAQYLIACYANHINLFDLPRNPTGKAGEYGFVEMLVQVPELTVGLFFIAVAAALAFTGARITTRESYFRILQESKTADAQSDLKDFVAMVTHEIKTPVQYLVTFSEYLTNASKASDEELSVVKKGVELQSSRLLDQLRKLVAVSSDERRAVNARANEQCSFNDVLSPLMIEAEAACKVKGIHFSHTVETSQIQAQVPVNAADLTTVIGNVVTNAIKFTPAGERIELRHAVDENAGTLTFTVADTGQGMTPDTLENLFVAFRQGEATITRQWSGMGLGMYMVKATVEEAGGRIDVQSHQGEGTQVAITLPATLKRVYSEHQRSVQSDLSGMISASVAEDEQLRHYRYPAHSPASGPSQGRVLLIDDEASIHLSFQTILSHYDITHGVSGAECIKAIHAQSFDVIILDVMLPKEDGIETLRKIRDADSHTPVLISSALLTYGQQSLIESAVSLGAQDVIHKPVDSVELAMRVKSLANTARLNRELREAQEQIVQTEKLGSLFFLANGLLHNLGNPLYQATTTLAALREKTAKPEHERFWSDVENSLRMAMRVISDLKLYSHPDSRIPSTFPVKEVVEQAIAFSGVPDDIISRDVEDRTIHSTYNDVLQILITFLSNAHDAIQNTEQPEIAIKLASHPDHGTSLYVCDNGPGVDNEASLFQPHYTTKPAGQGTGLGLYVASILAGNLGCEIGHQTRKPQGACFFIRFPRKTVEH